MSRRRFRRSKPFRTAKRNYIWVASFTTADEVIMTGAISELAIVNRDDWARNPSSQEVLEKGATLVRIIGDVRVRTDNGNDLPSLTGASYILGVRKTDEDNLEVLDLTADYFQEDWLWTRAGSIDPNNATTVAYAPRPSWRHEVDIGVKRKLTSEEEVRFGFGGFTAAGTEDPSSLLRVDHYFRCLIQLP